MRKYSEMLFIFEPYLAGWYPAQIKRKGATIRDFCTSHPEFILHDFVDHGPYADFSLKNEAMALGSAAWTHSRVGATEDWNTFPQFKQLYEEGYRRAGFRWPNKTRPCKLFCDNLHDIVEQYRNDRLIGNVGNYDIIVFSDDDGNVDVRRALV